MKKINGFLLAILIITSGSTFAQSGASMNIRAGINFQNINGENASGNKLSNTLKTGFNGGLIADIPVAPDYYFQTGLLYSTKGAKMENSNISELRLDYLEMPLHMVYKPALGKSKLLLGFGPYIAYGINGKAEGGVLNYEVKFQNDAPISTSTLYYKPFDAGADFLFGFEFDNNLSVQLNAQLGLLNNNAYNNNAIYKNTGFGVSVGFKL
jgi:hypothetical protein